ncbi:hypothetical protein [Nocardia sp. CA-120079]
MTEPTEEQRGDHADRVGHGVLPRHGGGVLSAECRCTSASLRKDRS